MSIFGSIFCANGTLLRENKEMFVLYFHYEQY